jgi:hypothetical protein
MTGAKLRRVLIISSICFILELLSFPVIGQQYLWTTNSKSLLSSSEMKVISKEEALNKILDYYGTYDYYYDYTGFSKVDFFHLFKQYNTGKDKKQWENIKRYFTITNELTITSVKGNTGNGSSILILIVKKNTVDMIAFSNQIASGAINTIRNEEAKFENFYKSLIEN